MKVVQLLGPSTGGIRQTVVALADGLRGEGIEVAIFGPVGVLDPIGRLDGVVPVPPRPGLAGLVRAAVALRRLSRDTDVVHAHGLKAGWVAMVARRRPWVLTIHNVVLDDIGRQARVIRRLERFVAARADAVIATSSEIERDFSAVARRIRTIRPVHHVAEPTDTAAVDAEFRRAGEPMVVCVARLHPQKGIDRLLDAWALGVEARLVVVGDGPQGEALTTQRDDLGLTDRVVFAGARTDATTVLAAADAVVIPSRWESGPLVLLEALGLGRPVVTTRVGFVDEVVGTDPGVAAVVVDVDADAAEMAGAIGALLIDGERRRRLSAAGPERARPFLDPTAAIAATLDVYSSVCR